MQKHAHNFKNFRVQCSVCGKEIVRSPSNARGKTVYCSSKCRYGSTRLIIHCKCCGKKFRRLKCRQSRYINSGFCSKKCSAKWHSGERSNTYKRELRICSIYKKQYLVVPSTAHKFCSSKCYQVWLSTSRMSNNNPYWKPKEKTVCPTCGITFEHHVSSKRKYCSRKCWQVVWFISPENRRKMLAALFKRPTRPEKLMDEIIKSNKLPYKYVGNGAVIIGKLNPDFIRTDNKKQVIEVFGDYWHSEKYADRKTMQQDIRIEMFHNMGYEILIIWEKELKKSFENVVNRVIEFSNTSTFLNAPYQKS